MQNSTNGFGNVSVKGRRRVPKPPTRIKAFMVIKKMVQTGISVWIAVKLKLEAPVKLTGGFWSVVKGKKTSDSDIAKVDRG